MTNTDTVRARFAPSPTGYLHIGGARTALFNYLLAKRLGGKFILRIEDTDQTRNIAGAETKLLEDLRWLGLQWDEGPEIGGPHGPYHQSQRLDRYRSVARKLIDDGLAYYATETDAELAALRRAAQDKKQSFRYPRPTQFITHAEADQARAAGRPAVVRLKAPNHDFIVRDQILGDVTIPAGEVDDFVLLKSDGWPTYHFAVVVDDEDMRITHVLRGQEHLMNTPRHMALQESLGFRTPAYAHLPIILNMDGSKMSKREKDKAVRTAVKDAITAGRLADADARRLADCGDDVYNAWLAGDTQLESDGLGRLATELRVPLPEIQIHDFRASGYLPDVLNNFIALLGWSPGDGREKFSLTELCAAFSLDRIGKTNARFDRAKLLSFNTEALAALPPESQLSAARDYIALHPESPLAGADDATLRRVLELCAGYRTFRDVEDKAGAIFLPDDRITLDPAAVQKVLLKNEREGLNVLKDLRPLLGEVATWTAGELERVVRAHGEGRGLGLGKVAQPLRVAVTGTTVSPSIFETLELMGRDKVLRRIDRTIVRPL